MNYDLLKSEIEELRIKKFALQDILDLYTFRKRLKSSMESINRYGTQAFGNESADTIESLLKSCDSWLDSMQQMLEEKINDEKLSINGRN